MWVDPFRQLKQAAAFRELHMYPTPNVKQKKLTLASVANLRVHLVNAHVTDSTFGLQPKPNPLSRILRNLGQLPQELYEGKALSCLPWLGDDDEGTSLSRISKYHLVCVLLDLYM